MPSDAGPFSFLRCMVLKIVYSFPNLWAEDLAMFSSLEGWQQEVERRGTTHLNSFRREVVLANTRGQYRAIFLARAQVDF